MATSPGPLLQSLDSLWTHLREHIPALPPARISLAPSTPSSNHGPERWARDGDGLVTGLVIGIDTLQAGAEDVLERVLHEAAHVLCWVRDVKDTTMRGAYHNASYLHAAEEVGLSTDVARVQGRGYASPQLTDATRALYVDDLKALTSAIPQVLPHLVVPAAPSSKRPDRLALQCQCTPKPRTIRVSQTVAALGAITCGVCDADFK